VRVPGDADVRGYLEDRPLFCFTTDIEWSPEWAIKETFALAWGHGVPLVPFVTHRSEWITSHFGPTLADAGIHPNFLPGSTHGANADEVIASLTELAPGARSFRAHCFYDDTRTLRKLADRGFTHDSNACAFLQPLLAPMRTVTNILRFPVFWEDDVHSTFGFEWTLDALRPALDTPGLKIVNVHPLRVALNVANEATWEHTRRRYEPLGSTPDAAAPGRGTRTLLEELFNYATRNDSRAYTLDELYRRAVDRGFALTRS
jgi:hypothetical protein